MIIGKKYKITWNTFIDQTETVGYYIGYKDCPFDCLEGLYPSDIYLSELKYPGINDCGYILQVPIREIVSIEQLHTL